ncbi:hypothetical protein CORC01_06035 [Colletotrichum orchidophilum]|uniref:Rhodopsin domain-containing protein n=1 Tax=Colletotrichum orchidophilum TaxID=1209926 RepID=A0A1G4BB08_9PEZI|nr:uncharacterized protein CORC01_06035 [Colletotrichum orchidophilum]OHE98584.1 hypothetical protein CORC01_06035 [Colletotrichum orchidophilum]
MDIPSIPDDPSSLPLTGTSAFVGQPPATQNDYFIVKGLFRMLGMTTANPMTGYFLAAKPPPGYAHETKLPGVLTGLIFVIVAVVAPTAARVWLRLRRGSVKQFGWDDWAIIAAALLALVYPIAQIHSLAVGAAALHTWEVTYEQYNIGMLGATVCKTTFFVAVGMIKLSIAIFLRRLADRLPRWWRIACDIFIGSTVAYILLAIFLNVFACNPPAAQWDLAFRGRREPAPSCIGQGVESKILTGFHVAQGLTLLSAPVVILWKIRMQTTKKTRLFAIWTIGGLAVLAGLLHQILPTITNDFTWNYTEALIWACLDLSLGVVTASLPVLDSLVEEYWRRAKSTVVKTYGGSNSSPSRTSEDSAWLYSKTAGTDKSRKHAARPPISNITQAMDRSESRESIVKKEEVHETQSCAIEMGILCTQEIEVHVSEAEDVENGRAESRGPRSPSPFYHNRPEWHDDSHKF